MKEPGKNDWIENYGFILVAFAHMTDWRLAEAEIQVINEKLQLMLAEAKQEFKEEDVAQKLVSILQRYDSLRMQEGDAMMNGLFDACESLKKESWFDKLSASVIVQFLAEIAESDHKIEKTEIQMLQNLANIFGVDPPRI
tara:strand:+ start:1918 stop:2337 length:420 start_codon:yes stop_codon:yes gene_type:complete